VPELSHVDAAGNARMVDVGAKEPTLRVAVAEGWVTLGDDAFRAVVERTAKKGDVLAVAQLAGIQACKRTSDLIPLCHPIPIDGVDVVVETADGRRVRCVATVRTHGRTGVEMEALTAVSVALLTVYDMLKAVDHGIEIGPIHLVSKSGGRSGTWERA
jgi:cyclic pyranopterin phosphate synthase